MHKFSPKNCNLFQINMVAVFLLRQSLQRIDCRMAFMFKNRKLWSTKWARQVDNFSISIKIPTAPGVVASSLHQTIYSPNRLGIQDKKRVEVLVL